MSDPYGPLYATPDDVRHVLQVKGLADPGQAGGSATGKDHVRAAIAGQSEWLQETTNRHWFEPDVDPEGTDLYTEPLTHRNDEVSIPSTPHADNRQMQVAASRQARYPVRHGGPYTRVKLTRRDVQEITELLVREPGGGYGDWIADDAKVEGRGEDYYVQKDDDVGFSRLYLHTRHIRALSGFANAVVATYDYGIEGVTDTVRRAIALKATAQLVHDDDASVAIPNDGSLISLESKAEAMEREAEELIDIHM